MPELPEVYTITKDLNKYVKGFTIRECEITEGYIAVPSNEAFCNFVKDTSIVEIERVAKNILIHLSNKKTIHIHLAMTGRLLLDTFKKETNWTRIVLTLEKGGNEKYLRFEDMRMFGKAAILSPQQVAELKGRHGPEPFDKDLTLDRFIEILRSKRTSIKNALLNQKLVSGLGNIYATDALFIAKIHPETPTLEITKEKALDLLNAIREVLKEAIKNRGSSIDTYVDLLGRKGKQQGNFRIYSKKFCPVCNSKLEVVKIGGRSTVFCSKCQTKIEQPNLL